MKKQLLFLVIILLPMIAHADKIGTCGDNITWTLNESTGTLTIEGSGAMEDFSYSTSVPWYEDIKSVTTVVIGDGVTNIGQNAFYGCSKLISVIIGNNVKSIGSDAFYKCFGLPSVTIPNSVTSIGSGAFRYCFGLTSITIPNSVTSIKSEAFYGVDFLTIISLIENPFFVNNYVFSPDTFYYATLYVPKGTIDKYKATSYWNWFKYIVEGDPTGINVVENKKHNNTTIYDLNGVRQLESKKGINIVNGKKVVMK